MPTATGDIPNPVESLAREPAHDEIARRAVTSMKNAAGNADASDWFQAERELRLLALHDVADRILATDGRVPPLERG